MEIRGSGGNVLDEEVEGALLLLVLSKDRLGLGLLNPLAPGIEIEN